MKPTQNMTLPCAVFGHNYIKSKTNSNRISELTCCNCKTIVTTDLRGNFEASTISNKRIQSILIKLFRLNLNLTKVTFSSQVNYN